MAKQNFLDLTGLTTVKNKILEIISNHTSNNDIHTSLEDKNKLTVAHEHSGSTHAPTDAEKNIIVGVLKNGENISINNRQVDISVPVYTSDLINNNDFATKSEMSTELTTHNTDENAHSVQMALKLDSSVANNFIKNIEYDNDTGVMTFTRNDNTILTVDLPIENMVESGSYDGDAKELILNLVSGETINIPATGLVGDYNGSDTDSISTTISADNIISATIRGNGVDRTHLSTELQASIASLESNEHTHSNKSILDATTASYTTEDKALVDTITNYLPLTGGTLSGNTFIKYDDTTWATYCMENSLRKIQIAINTSGYFGFYDNTNSKWIFQSYVSGNNAINGSLTLSDLASDSSAVLIGDTNGKLTKSTVTSANLTAMKSALALGYINNNNSGTSISMTNGTAKNMLTITLSAGCWLIVGGVRYTPPSDNSVTLTKSELCISTSTSMTTAPTQYVKHAEPNLSGENAALNVITVMNPTTDTTFYLNGRAYASGSSTATISALPRIFAVRIPKI